MGKGGLHGNCLRIAPALSLTAEEATDGTGETQTENIAPPAPDGATGWHDITVTVDP